MSKKTKDPFAKREAEKYDNPIHSRELILDWLKGRKAAATHSEMCYEFKYFDEDSIEALRRRLIAMSRDGQLVCNRKGAYLPAESVNLIKGRVQGHRDGFGFVIPDDASGDLFLSARQMQSVFHGDLVLVRVDDVDTRGRRIANIVEVLESNTTSVVGRFYQESGIAFVTPENSKITQDVLVAQGEWGQAEHGQYVVVEITRQPTMRTRPLGKVVEILGDHLAPGMEIEVAIRSHDIPFRWPEEVLEEVSHLSVDVTAADKSKRIDLRHLPFVTIDGEDARDFDDAVYCEKTASGWKLFVAIADVSHYVKNESALDREARIRGNSVYFPGHVIPMLPEVLSNGLCSLNPLVDRLCMVCEMTISLQGELVDFCFYESVMHSQARLTYNKVGAILEHPDSEEGAALREQYASVTPHLENLYMLFKTLRRSRDQRGAIDFDTVETMIVFGEGRKIEEIVPVVRNDAHKLIEECMLCANVATARFLINHDLNSLFRIHEGPGEEKLENLRSFLSELGLELTGGDEPAPSDYQRLIKQINERPDFNVIQTVMLRSLSQAYYGPEQKGHFGLGYQAYTHFTSPIRRYPDLSIHRAIKSVIYSDKQTREVKRPEGLDLRRYDHPYDVGYMVQLGEHCSMTERRADDATRDVANWLKCEYLEQHVGEDFTGVISAVTSFGVFVELQGVYIEGLVHVSSLSNDYYHFDAVKHRLVGERTGQSYGLGDQVEVVVVKVDLEERRIDFELKSLLGKARVDSRRGRSVAGKAGTSKRNLLKKLDAFSSSTDRTECKPKRGPRKRAVDGTAAVSGKEGGKPGSNAGRTDKSGAKKAGGKKNVVAGKKLKSSVSSPKKRKKSNAGKGKA
ncbi:MAG: ribonuclease R [Hahellaceae bacterium]|nr:ribonuclease R [Hahellaceae bacterium]MCP5212466.1 ribonuclease R [Hahellaceae bacterium]